MATRTHTIKILLDYATAKMCGNKLFEVRYNDRLYRRGDRIKYVVVDDNRATINHPLARKEYEIIYVLDNAPGIHPGYVVFGEKEVICR